MAWEKGKPRLLSLPSRRARSLAYGMTDFDGGAAADVGFCLLAVSASQRNEMSSTRPHEGRSLMTSCDSVFELEKLIIAGALRPASPSLVGSKSACHAQLISGCPSVVINVLAADDESPLHTSRLFSASSGADRLHQSRRHSGGIVGVTCATL